MLRIALAVPTFGVMDIALTSVENSRVIEKH